MNEDRSLPEVLLMRHGIAQERCDSLSDWERPLTAAGRERTRAVVERVAALGLRADRLLSSPLLRARQTAEIALEGGLGGSLELTEALACGADPLPLLRQLLAERYGERPWRRVLLVGHEPDLGDLAALLLGAPAGSIPLKKAGLALLELPDADRWEGRDPIGAARLRWLTGPRQLLDLA